MRPARYRGSALVTVLGVVVILATVTASLAVSVQVERMRLDAQAAADQRRTAALSAMTAAAALLRSPGDLDRPLYGTVRQLEAGGMAVRFTIQDQAGKLPVEALYGAAEEGQRREKLERLLSELEARGLPDGLEADRQLVSSPTRSGAADAGGTIADDVDLAETLAASGWRPCGQLFAVGDGETSVEGPALGTLLRRGGPAAVNVNTAPPEILRLVFLSRGFGHEVEGVLAARQQKPLDSVGELRRRHVLSEEAARAMGPLLTTTPGPVCVVAEVAMEESHETFVGFLVWKKGKPVLERFFSAHEAILQ